MNTPKETVERRSESAASTDAERALHDSETRHRAILDAALDGIITIDENGIIESMNPAGRRLFGYSEAEVVGRNINMLMPDPYHREHDQYLHNYRTTGQARIIGIGREVVGLRKNGTTFPMELAVIELSLSGRRVFTGTVHDITERKQAEQALRDSEMRHRAILDASLDGVITIDENGTIESINPAGQKLFGYSAREVVGQNVNMLMPQPYRGEHDTYLHNYRTTGRPRIIGVGREVVGLRKDGSTFPMDLAVIELNLSGRRVFTGTVHDITERKEAEHAIKQNEERFRTIADAIPQMMWTTGHDGAADYSNARWHQYTGLSFEQTEGWGWKDAMHPDDAERIIATWSDCLQTGGAYSGECRFKRGADGVYRWFLIRGVAVRDSGGDITRWIGTCTDIDDQKRAQDIEAARMEAETANRAKSEFLANMSHEIRTPMSAILGYADLLLDSDQTDSDRYNAINVIRRNGAHLLTVINDILDLSKIEAGEMNVEKIECSPCQILADVASLMRVRAKERGLKFELKTVGPIPETIQTDPTKLRQILINLIGNAVKFTEAGWVRVVAKLAGSTDSADPGMRFEVIDSGIGMSPEQVANLFHPFVQADTSTTRRFGGTGLGLVISQRLAKMLGGEIIVDSDSGRGSLFAVTIATGPLAAVKMLSDCTEVMVAPSAAPSQSDLRLHGRILLAEDGLDNQALLSGYLRRAGAQVEIAENGRIAYEQVTETLHSDPEPAFDLILMDMQMPELDGYGATAKLRSAGYEGPIIALTAHAMADDRTRCLQAGCTDYLSKPVHRSTLLSTLQRHMIGSSMLESASPLPPVPKSAGPAPDDSDDEVLNEFRPAFVASLPDEAHRILSYLSKQNLEELARAAHQLKGTAGLYRFMEISRSASSVEDSILTGATMDIIAAQVKELVDLLRGVAGPERAKKGKTAGRSKTVTKSSGNSRRRKKDRK